VAALTLFLFLCGFALSAKASDWPQFLGPTRNAVYPATDLSKSWPKEGPGKVWETRVGQGFSGPVVATKRLILFHRLADRETIECLDATSGKAIWSTDYPTTYRDDFGFDEGPRATPAISDGRVYTYGAEGVLGCTALESGTNLWRVNTKSGFKAAKGFFGIACSPLVEGNAVLLIIGGEKGSGVVAFDKSNGKVLWKSSDDQASYSSPIIANLHDHRCALCLTRSELLGLDPATGARLFQYAFEPPIHASVSAATPVVIGNRIFISACYDTGSALLDVLASAGAKLSVKSLWSMDDKLSNHYATSIHRDGFLYGLHGRTDPGFSPPPSLRCLEVETGKVSWEQPFEACTMILAGANLLILTERGELIRAPASPGAFKPEARAQVLPSGARAHPALANGFFYARSKDKLVCLDLRR
jgi:outer membrane protein assembly factor BamB